MNFRFAKLKRPRRALGTSRTAKRDGGAAVEAGLIMPFIIIIMMGTLEICSGLYLKESLAIAAFEGVRVGVRRRATAEMIRTRVVEVLDERGIVYSDEDIVIDPPNIDALLALDPITVTISVDTNTNSKFIFSHMANRTVRKAVTMVREFDPDVDADDSD